MATNRQTLAQALEVGLRRVAVAEFRQPGDMYTMAFNIGSTDRATETDQGFTDFGPMNEIGEGASVQYDDMLQGFTTTYTPLKYGKGFKVTEEMMDDDQNRVITRGVQNIGRSARHTLEYSAWNNFNNGFDSSYPGGDAKEWFATDHPLVGGGTFQNELTTAANLSQTAIEQAFIDLRTTVDDRGKFIVLNPTDIFVPPALEFTAKKLFMSEKDPDSANNTINAVRNSLRVHVVPYLTSTKAWFIKCNQHEAWFLWRKRLSFGRDGDFDTDNMKYKMKGRWVSGWSNPRGWYASPGV